MSESRPRRAEVPEPAVQRRPPALPLRAEIVRQLRRRRTLGIFIVLTVLPLILLLAFWLGDDDDSGGRGFVDLAQESGANLVVFTPVRLDQLPAGGDRGAVRRGHGAVGGQLVHPALPAGRAGPPRAAAAAEADRRRAVLGGRLRLPPGLDAAGRRHRLRLGPDDRPDRQPAPLAGHRRAVVDHHRLPADLDFRGRRVRLRDRDDDRCPAGRGRRRGAADDRVRDPGLDHRARQICGRACPATTRTPGPTRSPPPSSGRT